MRNQEKGKQIYKFKEQEEEKIKWLKVWVEEETSSVSNQVSDIYQLYDLRQVILCR